MKLKSLLGILIIKIPIRDFNFYTGYNNLLNINKII